MTPRSRQPCSPAFKLPRDQLSHGAGGAWLPAWGCRCLFCCSAAQAADESNDQPGQLMDNTDHAGAPVTSNGRVLRAVIVVGSTVSSHEYCKCTNHKPEYAPRWVEKSGPAIRAALLAHAPAEECAQFEAEFLSALAVAKKSFDLSKPQAVLTHWHALATMAANPPTDEECEQIERAKAGNYSGLSTTDENGNWVRL
jgi:hypothetical protein